MWARTTPADAAPPTWDEFVVQGVTWTRYVNEHHDEPWLEGEQSLDHDAMLARLESLEARITAIEARLGAADMGDDLSADLRAAITALSEFNPSP
jgi:hypothetical protein